MKQAGKCAGQKKKKSEEEAERLEGRHRPALGEKEETQREGKETNTREKSGRVTDGRKCGEKEGDRKLQTRRERLGKLDRSSSMKLHLAVDFKTPSPVPSSFDVSMAKWRYFRSLALCSIKGLYTAVRPTGKKIILGTSVNTL